MIESNEVSRMNEGVPRHDCTVVQINISLKKAKKKFFDNNGTIKTPIRKFNDILRGGPKKWLPTQPIKTHLHFRPLPEKTHPSAPPTAQTDRAAHLRSAASFIAKKFTLFPYNSHSIQLRSQSTEPFNDIINSIPTSESSYLTISPQSISDLPTSRIWLCGTRGSFRTLVFLNVPTQPCIPCKFTDPLVSKGFQTQEVFIVSYTVACFEGLPSSNSAGLQVTSQFENCPTLGTDKFVTESDITLLIFSVHLAATPLGLKRRFAGITSDGAGGIEPSHTVMNFSWQQCYQGKYCRREHGRRLFVSIDNNITYFLYTKACANAICQGWLRVLPALNSCTIKISSSHSTQPTTSPNLLHNSTVCSKSRVIQNVHPDCVSHRESLINQVWQTSNLANSENKMKTDIDKDSRQPGVPGAQPGTKTAK